METQQAALGAQNNEDESQIILFGNHASIERIPKRDERLKTSVVHAETCCDPHRLRMIIIATLEQKTSRELTNVTCPMLTRLLPRGAEWVLSLSLGL